MDKNWTTIDLLDVVGMATNPIKPGTKYAKRLLNVVPNERTGALTLRKGYALKYNPPEHPLIINSKFLNFETFVDRQINNEGVEITCLIQKGEMKSLGMPESTERLKGFWFWIRPYWNGTAFIDEWQLLNEVIITKVAGVDNNYLNRYKLYGSPYLHNITNNKFVGWILESRKGNSQVITHKNIGAEIYVNLTNDDLYLEVDDVVYLHRCYLPRRINEELYNNVKREDIVFHRINHDLRIGFGGRENRDGLMIGYRKNYLATEIKDGKYNHPEIQDPENQKLYRTLDRFIVDTILPDKNVCDIEIIQIAGGDKDHYYFRITTLIDGYQEILLQERYIKFDSGSKIKLITCVNTGFRNDRVNRIKVYISYDGKTYNLLRTDIVRSNDIAHKKLQLIDGKLKATYDQVDVPNSCMTQPPNETDDLGGWHVVGVERQQLHELLVRGVYNGYEDDKPAVPKSGQYQMLYIEKGRNTPYFRDLAAFTTMEIRSPQITTSRVHAQIKFSVYSRSDVTFIVTSEYPQGGQTPPSYPPPFRMITHGGKKEYVDYNFPLEIEGCIIIKTAGDVKEVILFDNFEVTYESPLEIIGKEMSLEMGYNPTHNLVRGWDDVVISRGRVYYLNPYIDKRYINFMFVSLITPSGSFLWDISSPQNFREIAASDSSYAVGIEELPNNEILILKDSSIMSMYDVGISGIPREPVYGVDCISRNSIVNINGVIYWCGKDEVYLLDISRGLVPIKTIRDTIRELYLGIDNKKEIFAVRSRYNTYRIRINKPNEKTEYVLTETGWVEERKYHFPEIYRYGVNNKIYFLSDGKIYEEQLEYYNKVVVYGQQQSDQ